MKYEFIKKHRSLFRMGKMCQVLGVSRSGYYSWLHRVPSKRSCENTVMEVEILDIYEKSRFTYGIIRTLKELLFRGFSCGWKRVRRLLRRLGLYPKTKKKFKVTTNSRHRYPVSPNLLKQDFTASCPDQVWVSDITYIRTGEGWLYLATVLDLYSRKIVGWALKECLTTDLVIDAFMQAVWSRKPMPGLIFHSDQGVQYACHAFRNLLRSYKFISSMSGKGNCYDNAVAESFFHTIKTELVYHEKYQTRKEATSSIFEYIEVFYNRIRRHSTLNYLCPVEFEKLKNVA